MSLSCEDLLHSIYLSEQLISEVILTDTGRWQHLTAFGVKRKTVHSVMFIATSMQHIAFFIKLGNRQIKHFFIWRAEDNIFSNAMTFIEWTFLNTTYRKVHRKVSIREFTQKPFRPQNHPIFCCTSSKQERRQRYRDTYSKELLHSDILIVFSNELEPTVTLHV